MSELQKDLLILLLTPLFLILFGVGLATQILNEDFKTVLFSFQNILTRITLFFGILGILGCYGVIKYGDESFWHFELNDDWPITKQHTLKIVIIFNLMAVFLGVFPYFVGGTDSLLEYAFIIAVFGIGTAFSLLILFVGTTISYRRMLRKY